MRKRLFVALCLLTAHLELQESSQGFIAPEFQVSTYTAGAQVYPKVAMEQSGSFMVVWEDWSAAHGSNVSVRGFAADGIPLAPEFHVGAFTTSFDQGPSIAADPLGGFLVVWTSFAMDGSLWGVFGRHLGGDGSPRGDEFQVNSFTTDSQIHPSVAMDGFGNSIVVWESLEQDGSGRGVFGRRFGSDGTPLGPDFQVNTYSTGSQEHPAVAADPEGNFLVVWESDEQDGDEEGVFARRFASDGTPQGAEWQVNDFTTSYQRNPSVAADASGNFVVVWTSDRNDGFDAGIFGRRFASEGSPLGAEFQVNTFTPHDQLRPSVSVDASGKFVVLWQGAYRDGSGDAVMGRRFGSDGTPLGGEFLVNGFSTGTQERPAVAADASGDFVVVWQSYVGYYSPYGVFGRRFNCADPRGDPSCDGDDLRLDVPWPGGSLDCSRSPVFWPTFRWYPGAYDAFRVEISPEPTFPKKRRVTSGDRLLDTATWTPTSRQWDLACRNAYRVRPGSPKMYIRILGVDSDLPKKNRDRKIYGPPTKVSVEPY